MPRVLLLVVFTLAFTSDVNGQQSALSDAYGVASEKLRAQEALLDKELKRLRQSLALGRDSAPPALDEAKEVWLKFRSRYCFAISQAFGGAYAGPHDLECQAKLTADFINEMKERTW